MTFDDFASLLIIFACVGLLLLMIPVLFYGMTVDFPTEKWCQRFNESDYPVLNDSYKMHMEWCIRNETGWHLNMSKPMIIENANYPRGFWE